ncbi:Rho GTPase activation protein [Auricularia subglabra TFB-10046 SS5]|nr:Rho GTPase activation protein [Auricularia subglabra TFB-10046 SS5]
MPRSGSAPGSAAGGVSGGSGGQRMRSKSSTQLRSSSEDSYGGRGQNQSLQAAAELIAGRRSVSGPRPSTTTNAPFYAVQKASASSASLAIKRAEANGRPRGQSLKGLIGAPVVDYEAARRMAPRWEGAGPVPVGVRDREKERREREEGDRIGFPRELKEEIQQFAGSDFAKRYFAKHSTGLIFKRRVPVEKMMTWQKAPLTTSLLNVPRSLQRDAVRVFRALQKIMGEGAGPAAANANTREEARWVLGEGVAHGELRDEVYCQLVKQLSANPNPQSVFKGWQFLCVLLITFPPSKNFETYLYAFLDRHLGVSEGRIDVMAKYCLRRLPIIARKGPRGRPPSVGEIESASDAAFNPSTFGEPLDAVMRLQARTYPGEGVPIILPFLADGILALGGTRAEGIFRVPGDGDAVAELKLRIDRGYYTLDGIDDPHVPASLLKLWLRELQEPLVPDELYDECIGADVLGAVQLVARLPTHNRRVVAFVVSFLQLFLEERVTARTKMTAPNLALVMAPNLVRCASESAAVVFANAQHEQRFVLNLLLNLHCDEIDPDFRPVHGRGAGTGRKS